ncbi:MAG: hypothetical protein RIE52_12150 [Balneola sp.]
MKLEAGKTYLNRKGEEVAVKEYGNPVFPFEGDNGHKYTIAGAISIGAINQNDLIEEVPQFKKGDRVLAGGNEDKLNPAVFLCYDEDVADKFVVRLDGFEYALGYKYCKPFEVKVTHQEIADWKGCGVKDLKVMK